MEENLNNQPQTRIYNLIILDKSGSMSSIRTAAYEGCNEVLNGIKTAAEQHAEEQEQFVSLLLFDTQSMPYIYQCTPAAEVAKLTQNQYQPCAATPLLDAMGKSLLELEQETSKYEDAVGMVTVITDGYENASREFTYSQIHELVGRLKSQGWNFAFMGANQDVDEVCINLNINRGNAREFSFDDGGMRESWQSECEANERYYEQMREARRKTAGMTQAARMNFYCKMNNAASFFEKNKGNENKENKKEKK